MISRSLYDENGRPIKKKKGFSSGSDYTHKSRKVNHTHHKDNLKDDEVKYRGRNSKKKKFDVDEIFGEGTIQVEKEANVDRYNTKGAKGMVLVYFWMAIISFFLGFIGIFLAVNVLIRVSKLQTHSEKKSQAIMISVFSILFNFITIFVLGITGNSIFGLLF